MKKSYFFAVLFSVVLSGLLGCDRFSPSKPSGADNQAEPSDAQKINVQTSAGDFVITLYPDKAPETVKQIIENVKNGVYDNSVIHNVVKDYEILIGGVKPTTGNPDSTEIVNEASVDNPNKKWTVAMLHDVDKTQSDSVQFFINLKDNFELDAQPGGESSPDTCGYCVFGIVTDGFPALETINNTNTKVNEEFEYAPDPDITIIKMSVQ